MPQFIDTAKIWIRSGKGGDGKDHLSTGGGGGGGGGSVATTYTVTFETNGGNKIDSVKVSKNGTLSKPTEPTKEGFDFDMFVWRMAATMACRMSIKANDYISYDDQVYLLNTLRKCENPFTCPHGRPTIITYTKYDLEKLFKRSLDQKE